ncbi:hypothetical protein SELMODRAFT_416301 [Selaginella moellendorffii]|uniref:Uncharacterized protein n=1 Tax=Selaginella moellendorffii TaxID=88036 RepID=D8RYV2_SELML|nr:hypothetical protein SELMODRAFT_416301 [Selaginella moellendorffii]
MASKSQLMLLAMFVTILLVGVDVKAQQPSRNANLAGTGTATSASSAPKAGTGIATIATNVSPVGSGVEANAQDTPRTQKEVSMSSFRHCLRIVLSQTRGPNLDQSVPSPSQGRIVSQLHI